MSYFVSISSGAGDIFLPNYIQVLSMLKIRSKSISKLHKSQVQRGESSYR